MSTHREPLHQPPNPDDLRRVPPADAVCARVRGMLRDYVDGDLTPDLGRAVEEHAHACRVCAVELARAEHEVLRLRRAFLPQRATEPELSPGFAQRVIDCIVSSDLVTDGDRDGGDRDDVDVGQPSIGEGARRERKRRERDGAIASPAGLLVASLFCLFVLGVGVRLFADGDAMPTGIARLDVLAATGTFDGRRQPLGIGDSLRERQSLWVARGGAARFDWHDPSARKQPAATIEMQGGEMRLQDGAPLLIDGKVLIETNRAVDIRMGDGSRIGLGLGEYVIAAEIPLDMLAQDQLDADGMPLDFLPGELRISVEVRSGQPARILRSGSALTLIAGQMGVYQGGGGVDISGPGPVASVEPRENRTIVENEPPPLSLLSGHVISPGGLPSVGAVVFLAFASQDTERKGFGVTAADGSFRLQTNSTCDSSFAVVLVAQPNELRQDLGMLAPHALPVRRQGVMAQLDHPLELATSALLSGQVRDETNQPRSGVQVMPCIVDELFGTVLALSHQARFTDQAGSFRIPRLPAKLPQHQSLAVLLLHPSLEPTVVPVPERGSPVAVGAEVITMVAHRTHLVRLEGLPSSTVVTIFEEVDGLPAGTAAVRRTASTDAFGRVNVMLVGHGRLWLRSVFANNLDVVDSLELVSTSPWPLYRPSLSPTPMGMHFRSLQSLVGAEVAVVNSWRHERFELSPVVNAVSSRALLTVDPAGVPVGNAEVFAVKQGGPRGSIDVRFLGFTSLAAGVLSLGALRPDEDIVAIAGDGSLGWIYRPANQLTILTLNPTGRVYVAESLRPAPTAPDRIVKIRFERMTEDLLPGMRPVAWRFASEANGWEVGGLPPGNYQVEVNGQTLEVPVPPMGWVELR